MEKKFLVEHICIVPLNTSQMKLDSVIFALILCYDRELYSQGWFVLDWIILWEDQLDIGGKVQTKNTFS